MEEHSIKVKGQCSTPWMAKIAEYTREKGMMQCIQDNI